MLWVLFKELEHTPLQLRYPPCITRWDLPCLRARSVWEEWCLELRFGLILLQVLVYVELSQHQRLSQASLQYVDILTLISSVFVHNVPKCRKLFCTPNPTAVGHSEIIEWKKIFLCLRYIQEVKPLSKTYRYLVLLVRINIFSQWFKQFSEKRSIQCIPEETWIGGHCSWNPVGITCWFYKAGFYLHLLIPLTNSSATLRVAFRHSCSTN